MPFFKKLVSHPVKRRYDHVDFIGIDLDKDVQVTIPVEVTGRAKGVVLGGKLEIFQERVLVRCLPTAIPDSVTPSTSPKWALMTRYSSTSWSCPKA